MKTKKGLLSLVVLLFIAVFLSIIVGDRMGESLDFVIVKSQNTKKHSATINFEEFVKRQLNVSETDPITLNEQINVNVINYLKTTEENWHIIDIKTQKKTNITLLELSLISKTIVLRPMPNVYVKRYTITNGIGKDKLLGFELKTSYSKTSFYFPKNYTVEVIVYK